MTTPASDPDDVFHQIASLLQEQRDGINSQNQMLGDLVSAITAETTARDHKVTAIQQQTKWIIGLMALVLLSVGFVIFSTVQNNREAEQRSKTATEQRETQLDNQRRLERYIVVSSKCDVENDRPADYEACLKRNGVE